MIDDQKLQEITEFAAERAEYYSRMLAGHYGYGMDEREDIKQELIFRVLQKIDNYDHTRASWHVYISRVVESKAINMIHASFCKCRDCRKKGYSLNDKMMKRKDNKKKEYIDDIEINDYWSRWGQDRRNKWEDEQMRIDVEKIIDEKVPLRLQWICNELLIKNKSKIAADHGMFRKVLRRKINMIRRIFNQEGLGGYIGIF